ncbi:MAG: arsenate reductase family protein [Proteiniphilum sp.]|nr:arsenate reductase family protein [Proteiniphilum sp.]
MKLFIQYPKCSTCRKAAKWLQDNNIEVEVRHIVEANPTAEELDVWIDRSGLEVQKFFNTSGKVYKENNLKDVVKTASREELVKLLASDGMLVKRPLLVGDDFVLVGFKEEDWQNVKL